MILQQIEVDGRNHLVIHFKFAINQPTAHIYQKHNMYFARINGVEYVLGSIKSDGHPELISMRIQDSFAYEEQQ